MENRGRRNPAEGAPQSSFFIRHSPIDRFSHCAESPRPVSRTIQGKPLALMTLHTISVLVENKFGVLARVAGMFSGRGYNIDSLNVAPTHDSTASRMTITTHGDEPTLE